MSFFDYKSVTISTTIPKRLYDEAKKRGWKHNDLWRAGFEARSGGSPLIERVNQLEKSKEELYKLLIVARARLKILEENKNKESE